MKSALGTGNSMGKGPVVGGGAAHSVGLPEPW